MKTQLILIADSDPKNLQILKENLEASGFQVITVTDGVKAWDEIQKTNPTLVLTEISLPGLTGFQLLEKIQADPNTSSTGLIFLTNQREIQQRVKSFQIGAKDYLVKPLHVKEVIAHIRMVLRRIDKRQEDQSDLYTKFSGRLNEISLADLIETFSVERRTGVLTLNNSNNKTGHLYFREGTVVNADMGDIRLENAIYQMLPWKNGYFNMVLKEITTPDEISISNLGLLLEGVKRMERREQLLKQFPSPKTAFTITPTFQTIIAKKKLPDDVKKFISLLDGKKSLLNILNDSCYDDFKTLERLLRLFKQGFIEPTVAPKVAEQAEKEKQTKPEQKPPEIETPTIEKIDEPPPPPEAPEIPIPIKERIEKRRTEVSIPEEQLFDEKEEKIKSEPKITKITEPTVEESSVPSFDQGAFIEKQKAIDSEETEKAQVEKSTETEIPKPYVPDKGDKNQLLVIGLDEDSLDEVMDTLTDNTFQSKQFEMLGNLMVHFGKIVDDEFNFIKVLGVLIDKPINQFVGAVKKNLIGNIFVLDCTKTDICEYASYLIHSTWDNFRLPYVIVITNYDEHSSMSIDVIRYKLNLNEQVEIIMWDHNNKSLIKKSITPLLLSPPKNEATSPDIVAEEQLEKATM